MTESQRLDAWYAEQREKGVVRDIKFSLSPEGKEMTVEALSKSINDTIALREVGRLKPYSGAEFDKMLEARFD